MMNFYARAALNLKKHTTLSVSEMLATRKFACHRFTDADVIHVLQTAMGVRDETLVPRYIYEHVVKHGVPDVHYQLAPGFERNRKQQDWDDYDCWAYEKNIESAWALTRNLPDMVNATENSPDPEDYGGGVGYADNDATSMTMLALLCYDHAQDYVGTEHADGNDYYARNEHPNDDDSDDCTYGNDYYARKKHADNYDSDKYTYGNDLVRKKHTDNYDSDKYSYDNDYYVHKKHNNYGSDADADYNWSPKHSRWSDSAWGDTCWWGDARNMKSWSSNSWDYCYSDDDYDKDTYERSWGKTRHNLRTRA